MRTRNGELNVRSEEKCLQCRLETVQGRRVANGARQPVPCRRTCDNECTSAEKYGTLYLFFNQVECRWGQNLPPPTFKTVAPPLPRRMIGQSATRMHRHDDIVLPRVCFARRDKQQCWLIDMRQCQVQQGILLLDGQSSLTFPSLSCVALRIRLRSHLSDVSFRLLTRSKSASHSFDNDCRARSLFFVRVTCATILFSYFLEVFQILQ